MASTINKRQQARAERTLQDLIRSVPGNDRCADCFARNPGWASWNLGVFLCVRCGSLHRKLGTHISKVKSLSMDAWSADQVENIKKQGNVASNRRYNPKNIKPNIPVDADEIDSAMERFIREKYQHKTLSGEERPLPSIRHHTGSSSSSNDIPPPLPPKNEPKFASSLRASSSTYPQRGQLPSPPASDATNSSSTSRGEPVRMSRIPEDEPHIRRRSFDAKLQSLRDMGFSDERRNNTVLMSLNGNVERAIEALVRLAEEDGASQGGVSIHTPRSGLSFDEPKRPRGSQSNLANGGTGHANTDPSNDDLDLSAAFVPRPTQSSTSLSSANPYNTNQPTSSQPAQALEQSFQNMTISQQAPIYSHKIGSWNQSAPQNPHTNSSQNTFTPPISPPPVQYTAASSQVNSSTSSFDQSNPFSSLSRSQTLPVSNPYATSIQPPQQQVQRQIQQQPPQMPQVPDWAQRSVSQPLAQNQPQPQHQFQQQPYNLQQQQTSLASPLQNQQYPQFQQYPSAQQNGTTQFQPNNSYQMQPNQQQPNMVNGFSQSSQNPFFGQQQQQPQQQAFQQTQQSPQYASNPQQSFPQQQYGAPAPLHTQFTGAPFRDKSSILALYNSPTNTSGTQQFSQTMQQFPPQQQPQQQPQFQYSHNSSQSSEFAPPVAIPHRSATMPSMPQMGGQASSQPQYPMQSNGYGAPMNHSGQLGNTYGGQMPAQPMFGASAAGMGRSGSPDAFRSLSARLG